MKVRFLTSVADGVMGEFMEGRVITIDPAAPDFQTFTQWLKAGILAPVREGEDVVVRPSTALERAVAIPSRSRASGRGRRSSALAADRA